MSTHRVLVHRLDLKPHPDATSLSIQKLSDGNVVVLRTVDWANGQLACHVEPDYEVKTTDPRFAWMSEPNHPERDWVRVKPVKLRGVQSYGLMIPAEAGMVEGEDVLSKLSAVIRRWEAPQPVKTGGQAGSPPKLIAPKYDVEGYFKNTAWFVDGEQTVACEKVHGSSARYVFLEDQFWCGSRTEWKRDEEGSIWWRVLRTTPGLQSFCRAHPGVLVYGEVIGMNPGFHYGCDHKKGELKFVAFDLLFQRHNETGLPYYADWDVVKEIRSKHPDLPWVPVLYEGPWNIDILKRLAEGTTLMGGAGIEDIREGLVVRPTRERRSDKFERVQVKFVSEDYLTKD